MQNALLIIRVIGLGIRIMEEHMEDHVEDHMEGHIEDQMEKGM